MFFCKQMTAYEMRISDWSSDVRSADLLFLVERRDQPGLHAEARDFEIVVLDRQRPARIGKLRLIGPREHVIARDFGFGRNQHGRVIVRSEEHTSELQSLMHISYAVFCLKKKTKTHTELHLI